MKLKRKLYIYLTVIVFLFSTILIIPIESVRVCASNYINSEIDNRYPQNVSYTAPYRIYTYDVYGNREGNRWADVGDSCTIFEAYTSGFCKIQYPALEGTRTAYALISDCDGYNPVYIAPTGYNISVSSTEIYDCETVRIEITAYDNLATGYKIYVVKPDGTLMGCKDLKENNSIIFMPNAPGVWKVYAEVYNQYGSFVGAVDNGGMEIRVLNPPDLGSKVDLGTDFYAYIVNTHSGNVLTNDNDNVSCRTKQSTTNQQWKFKKKSDGSYEIESVSVSGKHLDEYSGKGKQGDNVQVYTASADENVQSWFIYSAGNGSFYFRPSCSNSAVLDVYDASTESGANVQIWAYNQTDAQKFKIDKIGNASFRFSTKTVNLDLSGTKNASVNVTADGLLPDTYSYNCNRDSSALDVSWGGWNGSTNTLNLTAKKTGTYTVKVSLLNYDTNEVLYTDSFTVYITCSHNYVSEVIPATSTSQGYTLHTCKNCSYSYKDNYTDPLGIDLSNCSIVLGTTSYTYDGTAKQPTVTVKNGSTTLTNGTHYSVSYSNNTNVGTAKATIAGKGDYTGTVTKTFTIIAKSIPGATVTLGTTSYVYDGTEKKPTVTVKDGSKTLTSGTDYTVSYSNNKNAGTATATVTGKGNYKDTATKTFTISKKSISGAAVTLNPTSYTYDGTAKKPAATVKVDSKALTSGTDYTVDYVNNVNVGTATAKITGKGNYTGTASANFTITEKHKIDITSCTISLSPASYVYDGTAKQLTVTVKNGLTTLTNGTHYSVSYSNNTNVGTAKVTIIGKGDYTGSVTKTFSITAKSISGATVTLGTTSYVYDGTEKKPSMTVKDGSKTLTNGTDYTVSYSSNKNAGTATVTVTGKGNYKDTASKIFTITAKSIAGSTVTLSQTTYTYDGTDKKPTVTVKDGSKTLTNGTDYSVAYPSDCKNVGNKTVTITGKINYTGSISKTYVIYPKTEKFIWGTDNWKFGNSGYYFFNYNVNDKVKQQLKKDYNLTPYTMTQLEKQIEARNRYAWKGSCQGMTVSQILAKQGDLDLSRYGGNKVVNNNDATDDMKSVINFFQVMQSDTDVIKAIRQSKFNNFRYSYTQAEFLKTLESACNSKYLLNFTYGLYDYNYNTGIDNFSYHSVLAYGIEDTYYPSDITGLTYNKKVLIADPNRLSGNKMDNEAVLYYNSSTNAWIIPYWNCTCTINGERHLRRCYYSPSEGTNPKYGVITGIYIYESANEIKDLMSDVGSDHYLAGLSIDKTSNNASIVSKVTDTGNSNYNYAGDIDDGILRYDTLLADEFNVDKTEEMYAFWNPTASYTLSYTKPTDFDVKMDYEGLIYYADLTNATYTLFKPDGSIKFNGSNSDYKVSILTDTSDMVNDWYMLTVSGNKTDNFELNKVKGGYVLSLPNINKLMIEAQGEGINDSLNLSTKYNRVFIYELANKKIGIKVDTDNNGTYETELEISGNQTKIPGDVSGDGKLTMKDLSLLQRYINGWDVEIVTSVADVDNSGKINMRDYALIQRKINGWDVELK